VLVRDFDQGLGIGQHTGRGLGVHEGHDADIGVFPERVFQLLRIDRLAPLVLDHNGNAAAALDVFDHAPAEHAVAAHDHLVAGLHHVDETVLHADRARSRYRERQRVLGLVGVAQQRLQLLHHFDENRVEIADGGLAHGGQHARMDFRRPRPHQRALRGMERADAFGRREFDHRVTP